MLGEYFHPDRVFCRVLDEKPPSSCWLSPCSDRCQCQPFIQINVITQLWVNLFTHNSLIMVVWMKPLVFRTSHKRCHCNIFIQMRSIIRKWMKNFIQEVRFPHSWVIYISAGVNIFIHSSGIYWLRMKIARHSHNSRNLCVRNPYLRH